MRSSPLTSASAWPPQKEVFKEGAAVAGWKHRITLQAGNLSVRHITRRLDTDDPVFCLAAWTVEDDGL
jgi:hypothetical protein